MESNKQEWDRGHASGGESKEKELRRVLLKNHVTGSMKLSSGFTNNLSTQPISSLESTQPKQPEQDSINQIYFKTQD